MLIKSFKSFILSTFVVLALARPQKAKVSPNEDRTLICGVGEPTKAFLEQAGSFQIAEQSLNSQDMLAAGSIGVKVYYHVVAIDDTEELGYIPYEKTIRKQHAAINSAFRGSGINFVFQSLDYTINPEWSTSYNDTAMRTKLRKGRYQDLNLYFTQQMTEGGFNLMGRCTLPTNAPEGSLAFNMDGCNVHSYALPEGEFPAGSKGYTAVHEIGHWFGLLHTFQGGCYGSGDFVDDTPAQAQANYICRTEIPDTCVGDDFPGLDPINNFMDLSDDKCRNTFTVGQINRMKSFWNLWRKDT